jgi:hypothetical protein
MGKVDSGGDHIDIKTIIFGSALMGGSTLAMVVVAKLVEWAYVGITFHIQSGMNACRQRSYSQDNPGFIHHH